MEIELGAGGLVVLALIITFAYIIVGTTGFGASTISVPLAVHLLPLTLVVPMMVVFDLIGGLLLGGRNLKSVDRRELGRLLPFMFIGIALGASLLLNSPQRPLLLLLGATVLCNAAWGLWGRPAGRPIASAWSILSGTVGGVFSALFGTGGPIYTIYLARRINDKGRLRATISTLILVSAIARLATFALAGTYAQRELHVLLPLLLPCVLGGLFIGNRLHQRLSGSQMIRGVWALLLLSGIALLVKNA